MESARRIHDPRYDAAMARGADAVRQGSFAEARDAYEEALRLAESNADRGAIDRAHLNLSMVHVQSGNAKTGEEGLREILLRTADPKVAFHAAYNLASSLRRQGRLERAERFARRAMEHATTLGGPDFEAPAHNLLGNLYLTRSYHREALEEYRQALALRETQGGDTRWSRAILLENIGYCLLLSGDTRTGLERLDEALALAIAVGDRRCRAECLQDLCYGHLVRSELREAAAFGSEALEEAADAGYSDIVENCHYLLGEIGTRTGDFRLRDQHFGALQRLHPELPFLREFLCAVDVTGIITLKR